MFQVIEKSASDWRVAPNLRDYDALCRSFDWTSERQARSEDDLRNDIGLDSMDFLNFVIAAHKQLDVDVPEADYGKITSLSKFTRYIAAR